MEYTVWFAWNSYSLPVRTRLVKDQDTTGPSGLGNVETNGKNQNKAGSQLLSIENRIWL